MKEELRKELQDFIHHLKSKEIHLIKIESGMGTPASQESIEKTIDSFIDEKFPKMTREEEIAETHKRG